MPSNPETCSHKPSYLDWFNSAVLFGAFVAAGAAAIFTWDQVDATRKQIERAHEDTQIAQRAYVYAAPGPVFHVTDGSKLEGTVIIGNSGQTVAKKVQRWVGMAVHGARTPDTMEGIGRLEREDGVLTISPRVQHQVIRIRPRILEPQISRIKSEQGEQRIYIFGIITYKDIFENPHMTSFCHIYYGSNLAPQRKDEIASIYLGEYAKYCDKHNDAD